MFTLRDKYVAAGSPAQQDGTASYWTTYLASDDVYDTAATSSTSAG